MNESDPNNQKNSSQTPQNSGQQPNQPNPGQPYSAPQYSGQPYNPQLYPGQSNQGSYTNQNYNQYQQYPGQYNPSQFNGQNTQPGKGKNALNIGKGIGSRILYFIVAIFVFLFIFLLKFGIVKAVHSMFDDHSNKTVTTSSSVQFTYDPTTSNEPQTSSTAPSFNQNALIGTCYYFNGFSPVEESCSNPKATYKTLRQGTEAECRSTSDGVLTSNKGKAYCLGLNLTENQCYLYMDSNTKMIQYAPCSDPNSQRVFKIIKGSTNEEDCREYADGKRFMYLPFGDPKSMACIFPHQ